ncbi:MAG: hypothetical protein R2864_13135 [Syntrophotaleaceae bacterium]
MPNKRRGGSSSAGVIAPIFFNTAQDSGHCPWNWRSAPCSTAPRW